MQFDATACYCWRWRTFAFVHFFSLHFTSVFIPLFHLFFSSLVLTFSCFLRSKLIYLAQRSTYVIITYFSILFYINFFWSVIKACNHKAKANDKKNIIKCIKAHTSQHEYSRAHLQTTLWISLQDLIDFFFFLSTEKGMWEYVGSLSLPVHFFVMSTTDFVKEGYGCCCC